MAPWTWRVFAGALRGQHARALGRSKEVVEAGRVRSRRGGGRGGTAGGGLEKGGSGWSSGLHGGHWQPTMDGELSASKEEQRRAGSRAAKCWSVRSEGAKARILRTMRSTQRSGGGLSRRLVERLKCVELVDGRGWKRLCHAQRRSILDGLTGPTMDGIVWDNRQRGSELAMMLLLLMCMHEER